MEGTDLVSAVYAISVSKTLSLMLETHIGRFCLLYSTCTVVWQFFYLVIDSFIKLLTAGIAHTTAVAVNVIACPDTASLPKLSCTSQRHCCAREAYSISRLYIGIEVKYTHACVLLNI